MRFALSPTPIAPLEEKLCSLINGVFWVWWISPILGLWKFYLWVNHGKVNKMTSLWVHIISLREGLWGSEIVQSTSNFVKEFDGRTFRYEFLRITPLRRTFQMSKMLKKWKKWKNPNFQDEFFSTSSYFGCLICSEMKSLINLEVFCTILKHFMTISGVFWIWWISPILGLWKFELWVFGQQNVSLGNILGNIIYVFQKYTYRALFTRRLRS